MSTSPVSNDPASNSILQNYLNQQAQQTAANATAAASDTGSSALAQATSASTIGSNFNTFINILTTQLQHQDPTNASDPNQFTQELVEFAGVEQQLNTNNNLRTLINLQKASTGAAAALGFMGQYVQAASPAGGLPLQNGQAEIGYNLTTNAASTAINVKDANGTTVATLTGSNGIGMNYVTWDGKDSSGNQLPDGLYKFAITVKNADGTPQTPTTTEIIGKVTGITTNTDGTTRLSLGAMPIDMSTVDSIFSAGNLPVSTQPSS